MVMEDKFSEINSQPMIMDVLERMQTLLPSTLEYMDHLKSLFYCTICGYSNQQFIDTKKKTATFSAESCDSLVRNTFMFSYLMNNLLLPFITNASEFMVKAMGNKAHKPLRIRQLGHIKKAVEECAEDFRENDEDLGGCLKFCGFFKLNRNTPEIEGYPHLFANFVVQMDVFIATGGTITEKKADKPSAAKKGPPEKKVEDGADDDEEDPGKKAEEDENTVKKKDKVKKKEKESKEKSKEKDKTDKKTKKNKDDDDNDNDDDKNKKKKKEKEENKTRRIRMRVLEEILTGVENKNTPLRILEEVKAEANPEDKAKTDNKKKDKDDKFVDVFEYKVFFQKMMAGSIFSVQNDNKESGEQWTGMLTELQSVLDANRVEGVDMIIRQIYVDDYMPEMDDVDGEIFSQPTHCGVHLDKYKTCFGFSSIDITEDVKKVNWNISLRMLVASMQGKAEKGPSNDHIDRVVVEVANTITNKSVRDFHRDNYLRFRGHNFYRQPHVIQNLYHYKVQKGEEEYIKTAINATRLIANVSGPEESGKMKAMLETQEKRFAKKMLRAMERVNLQIGGADMVRLKEIEDKIGQSTLPELIRLQQDFKKMEVMCVGDKRSTPVCVKAYDSLANLVDLDHTEPGFSETAHEILNINMHNRITIIRQTPEKVQKEIDAMVEIEKTCGEIIKTKPEDPKCKEAIERANLIIQCPAPLGPEFFAKWKEEAAKVMTGAVEFKKKGEVPKSPTDPAEKAKGDGEKAKVIPPAPTTPADTP